MKENEKGRRSFLKHLMAGTAVVAGVAGTKKSAQAKKALDTPLDESETLYKETDAFKQYYKSLRY
jgi:hypothetical protein